MMAVRLKDFLWKVGDMCRNAVTSEKVCNFVAERVAVVVEQVIAVASVHSILKHVICKANK